MKACVRAASVRRSPRLVHGPQACARSSQRDIEQKNRNAKNQNAKVIRSDPSSDCRERLGLVPAVLPVSENE